MCESGSAELWLFVPRVKGAVVALMVLLLLYGKLTGSRACKGT
jgi:hypothetical protein